MIVASLLVSTGQAALALGLGELRTVSRLGDRLQVEITLTAASDERIEAGCVRLKKPLGDDGLPWLRQGSHSVRRGAVSVLAIRSDAPVFDPIIQIGVNVGCGFEVQRDYTIFLSPRMAEPELPVANRIEQAAPRPLQRSERARVQPRQGVSESYGAAPERILPSPPKRAPKVRAGETSRKDRLVLFADGATGEPSLALSTSLDTWRDGEETAERAAQRESLRVEYRMLQALHQQALSLLETAEKLRQLEQTLNELQQRTDELSRQGGAVPETTAPEAESTTPAPPAAVPAQVVAEAPVTPKPTRGNDGWMFYSAMVASLVLVIVWLLWRQWQNNRSIPEFSRLPPELVVDPQRGAEIAGNDDIDFDVGERAQPGIANVDVKFDDTAPPPEQEAPAASGSISSHFSVAAASVDEHFEVNPVMELADIMLSFGRVKGAAQALQEFVDHNPEEALQPWIRLMEVYRLAGMREEFERVAANLNQYFNVEVQNWDSAQPGTLVSKDAPTIAAGGREEPLPIEWPSSAKKPRSIEDMPHIRDRVTQLWGSADLDAYLQGLLRDNRGGLRSGFTIEVVDELLFLIQLQETVSKMDAESAIKESQ
ncbi:MAG TPA: hypothetical protein PLW86_03045 [Rhodocyclaceae bacterium]|nr:hypothetical protein [Rhodocyclaceae bacterium]